MPGQQGRQPRKMGRPPKPQGEVRRNRIAIMVTDAELRALEQVAEQRRQPLGTIVHELLAKLLKSRRKR
jgi:hypothetical protein